MITVSFIKNSDNETVGFSSEGHAGYAVFGNDIICSAVSALVINCVNSIDTLTIDGKFMNIYQDTKKGIMRCTFSQPVSSQTALLMESLRVGIRSIRDEYGSQYIKLED